MSRELKGAGCHVAEQQECGQYLSRLPGSLLQPALPRLYTIGKVALDRFLRDAILQRLDYRNRNPTETA